MQRQTVEKSREGKTEEGQGSGMGEEEELKEHVQTVRRGLQSADAKKTGFWSWFGNSQVWL